MAMTPTGHSLSPEVADLQARIAELEAALRASEDRTRLLLDSAVEAIYGIDRAGCCTFANAACARLLGYRAEGELLGRRMHDLIHHTCPDGSPYPPEECHINRVLQTGRGVYVDDEVLWRADGLSFPVEYWAYPVRQDGHLIGTVVTFLDITQRRLAEAALQRRAHEMAVLNEVSLEINSQPNLPALLNTIVEKAAGLLGAHLGGLYLVRPDGQSLELVVGHNLPGQYVGIVLKLGEGLSGKVAQSGESMIVADYQRWEGRAAVYAESPFRRVLGVPLKTGGKVIGVINVIDDRQAGAFSAEEVQLVTLFADQAAIAVMNVRLYEAAQRELIEVGRAEQVQAALFRISEAAHSASNLGELYAAIHRTVNELMPARNFGLALYDAASDTIHFPYFVDEEYHLSAPPPRRRSNGLVEYVLRTGEPLLGTLEEIKALAASEQLQPLGRQAQSWLGVPLKLQGKTIGVMVAQTYQEGEHLTKEHQEILTFVSAQVVMTIQRKRAEQVQASLYRISEAALTAHSLDELYRLIHRIVDELMPAKNLYIALYDEETDLIRYPYVVDEVDDSTPVHRLGKGLTAYVLRTGQPLFAPPEVFDDLVARGEVELIGPPSVDWLGAPLKADGHTIGVIAVQTYSEHVRLTEEHKEILVFVSSQVAMAIQRRRVEDALRASEQRYRELFDAANRQAQELTLLDRVRTAVARELDLAALFRTVVTAIAETFGYALVSLYILHDRTLELQYQVGYPQVFESIPLELGVTGRVARTSQPVLLEDVHVDPVYLPALAEVVSEVCVPLFDAGQIAGILNIESTQGVRLTAADLRLMVALSEHIGVAISRARLYQEARDSAARLTAAVENLPFDFWAIGPDGRYVMQNWASIQHWGNRLGTRPDEVALDPATLALWQEQNRRAFAGETIEGEITYPEGETPRHYYQIISPIWSDGQVRGILGVNIDITDRYNAQVALQASEARLRAVLSNTPIVLFALDRAGTVTFVEGKGLEALEGRLEGAEGGSILEVLRGVRRLSTAVERALSGEALNFVFEFEQLSFEAWLSPLTSSDGAVSGVIGVAVDVTERERTALALRESEERYRLLFENNPHPMWAYDLETLAILEVNDAAIRHYGYSRDQFLGMTIADLHPPEEIPTLRDNVAHVTSGVDEAGHWRHRKKDGSLIEVDITSHTLTLNGRLAEVVLVTDVTERRRTEEALRRAQKMESLGLLAGGIAHDFNNLLVAMLGQTSLAQAKLAPQHEARPHIEKAINAAQRAATLTRQLLAYSGKTQFDWHPFNLNTLIQENLHLFEVTVPKTVELRSQLSPALPLIEGDQGQVQQVIMNLIINAAEAIGERPGWVMVRTKVSDLTDADLAAWRIGEENLTPGRYVMLEVEDNGSGMEPETLSKIFDPFFTTKFTGRGLGLAAVLGIVRGHKGGLQVKSTQQVGTQFQIVFPVGAVAVTTAELPKPLQELALIRHAVLVIDDEAPVRDAVTDILALEDIPVMIAPDGQTGIDLYRQHQAEVRLVILDLSMPGLSGEETLRELRKINAQVPVLLSSGYSQDEVTQRFAGQAELGFIQKPYEIDRLIDEVKRRLVA